MILLKTHSQDSDQRNDYNIHVECGTYTGLTMGYPRPPLEASQFYAFTPPGHFLWKWKQASDCPQPMLSGNWFQTRGLHFHYPSSSSNAFQSQSGPLFLPYPSSTFINCNRPTGVLKGTIYFFPDDFKIKGEKDALELLCIWAPMAETIYLQMCSDQLHTDLFVMLQWLKLMTIWRQWEMVSLSEAGIRALSTMLSWRFSP